MKHYNECGLKKGRGEAASCNLNWHNNLLYMSKVRPAWCYTYKFQFRSWRWCTSSYMAALITSFYRRIHSRGREAWGTFIEHTIPLRGWNRGCCRRQRKVGCAPSLFLALVAERRDDWILPRRPPHWSRRRRLRLQRVHRPRVARGGPGKQVSRAALLWFNVNLIKVERVPCFRIGFGLDIFAWNSFFFS